MATLASPPIAPQVGAILDALGEVADLRRNRLGDSMADVIAAGVQNRTLEQQKSPDGEGIPANRGRYGQRKRSRGIRVGVGLYGDEVGGEMLEFENCRGQVAVTPGELSMTYGANPEVREIAEYFTEGNPANNQPPRPFYELDARIEDDAFALVEEAAEARIRELGGS